MTGRVLRVLAALWPYASLALAVLATWALFSEALGLAPFALTIAMLALSNLAAARYVQATEPTPGTSPKCGPRG